MVFTLQTAHCNGADRPAVECQNLHLHMHVHNDGGRGRSSTLQSAAPSVCSSSRSGFPQSSRISELPSSSSTRTSSRAPSSTWSRCSATTSRAAEYDSSIPSSYMLPSGTTRGRSSSRTTDAYDAFRSGNYSTSLHIPKDSRYPVPGSELTRGTSIRRGAPPSSFSTRVPPSSYRPSSSEFLSSRMSRASDRTATQSTYRPSSSGVSSSRVSSTSRGTVAPSAAPSCIGSSRAPSATMYSSGDGIRSSTVGPNDSMSRRPSTSKRSSSRSRFGRFF